MTTKSKSKRVESKASFRVVQFKCGTSRKKHEVKGTKLKVRRRFTDTQQKNYMNLVMQFPLMPIIDDEHLDEAVAVLQSLVGVKGTPALDAYTEALADLVEAYDAKNNPSEPLADDEVLEGLLEHRGMTQAELSQATGVAKSTISGVLNGKRKLSRDAAQAIADHCGVDITVFNKRF